MPDNDPEATMKLPDPGPPLSAGELLARALGDPGPTGGGRWIPPEPEELAALLPQYRIESLLGHGGMGAVYKGFQTALDRPVAIKLLPLEVSADQAFADRFVREARTLAKLNHPNIVGVYDFGKTSAGHLYFVMEFVEGTDLHKMIHGPGLNPAQALPIIVGVCEALQYAHGKGVVHRDIKPANVMVNTEGTVKVADFGLARLNTPDTDSGGLTMTGTVMGTPAYMAPEQTRGMHVDHRADIYSLGVMLYEMLCGEIPRGVFDPPSHKVQVDVRLDEVVLKAMNSEPERRYQNTVEMKTDVDRIRTTPEQRKPAPKQKSKSPVAAAVIAVCLTLASAAGFVIWKKAGEANVVRGLGTTRAFTPLPLEGGKEVVTQDGWKQLDSGSFMKVPVTATSGVVRVRVGWTDKSQLIKLSIGEQRQLWITDKVAAWHRFPGEEPGTVEEPAKLEFEKPLSPGAELVVQIAWVGNRHFAWVDGHSAGTRKWTANAGAPKDILIWVDKDGQGARFKDLEILSLDGLSDAEALKLAESHASGPAVATVSPSPRLPVSVSSTATGEAWVRKLAKPEDHRPSNSTILQDGWVFRRNDATDGARILGTSMSDGAVRAEFRGVDGDYSPQLWLRDSKGKRYQLARKSNALRLEHHDSTSKKSILVKEYAISASQLGGTFNLELRAAGRTLSVKLDGKQIISVEDETLATGNPAVFLSEKGGMRNIEVLNLDQPAATAVSPSPSLPVSVSSTATGETWVRKYDKPGDFPPTNPAVLQDGWIVRRPGATRNSHSFLDPWRDCAIRAECRWDKDWSDQAGLWLRSENSHKYALLRTQDAVQLVIFTGQGGERPTLKRYPVSEPKNGDVFTLELRIVGSTLTAKLDGREVIRVEDDRLPSGGPGIYIPKKGGLRNIEVLNLDKPAAAAISPSPSLPVSKSSASATKDAPFINTLGMKFVPVPITGGPTGGQRVLFSVWETRVQDYEEFAKDTKHPWPNTTDFEQGPTHPAVAMTWEDTQAFCAWLTARERKAGRLGADEEYRLPTDHEWSCAVGLGGKEDALAPPLEKANANKDIYPWGKQWPPPVVVNIAGEEMNEIPRKGQPINGLEGYRDSYPRTSPVGSFAPDGVGLLYDMGGNAREWCQDGAAPGEKNRILRGGAWLYSDQNSAFSSRRAAFPILGQLGSNWRSDVLGFRVVLAPATP